MSFTSSTCFTKKQRALLSWQFFSTTLLYQSSLNAQSLTPEQATLAKNGTRVLNTYCKKCHGDGLVWPGLDMTDREGLLNPANGTPPYVVPGDLESSRIWKALGITHDAHHPTSHSLRRKTLSSLNSGFYRGPISPTPLTAPNASFLGDKSIIKFIADDLDDVNAEAIPYTRYFSLAHLLEQ